MANDKTPEPVHGQPGEEQTPEYNEALRQQLERDRVSYEKLGNQEQLDAIDARLAELGPAPAAAGGSGYDAQTKDELYAEAQRRGIEGVSAMNKADLIATLEQDDRGEVPTEEG